MTAPSREPIATETQACDAPGDDRTVTCLCQAEQALAQGQHSAALTWLDEHTVASLEAAAQPELLFRLAALFHQTRQLDRAERAYRCVLDLTSHTLALVNLAHICQFRGQVSEAIALRRQALERTGPDPGLCRDLGCSLIFMGDKQAGMAYLGQAVTQAPQDRDIHSSYLFRLHYMPDLCPEQSFAEHRRWAQQHAPPGLARGSHTNLPDPGRQLRLAYISPDFRSHPVATFFEPLLEAHDRQGFQVFGYGNVACPDDVTLRLQEMFDLYRPVFGWSDQAIEQQIRADGIDILVDLAGHTPGNCLGVLALKPAPIQGSYLGYPDTTGMEQVDFRLVDGLSTPEDLQVFHTERLISLPHGFLCYRPPDQTPDVGPLPALQNGHVTFGAFNDSNKLNEPMLACWARTVSAVPGAQLLIKSRAAGDALWCQALKQKLEHLGLNPARVRIEGQKTVRAYFQLYHQVDIALDSFPYNGTTTLCDALWMGVPVMSLVGRHHAARMGLSILSRVGLEFFAPDTAGLFCARARVLASKLDALGQIRSSLRRRVRHSPLADPRALAGHTEAAYRRLWRQWCEKGTDMPKAEEKSAQKKKGLNGI